MESAAQFIANWGRPECKHLCAVWRAGENNRQFASKGPRIATDNILIPLSILVENVLRSNPNEEAFLALNKFMNHIQLRMGLNRQTTLVETVLTEEELAEYQTLGNIAAHRMQEIYFASETGPSAVEMNTTLLEKESHNGCAREVLSIGGQRKIAGGLLMAKGSNKRSSTE